MHLLIISGFLGSGKTSLLLKVAEYLSRERKLKVAIIENEVGKIGMDDYVLKEENFEVREIYSGCICCSLRLDLISTLLELEVNYKPDVVIVEPSGVAGPKQLLNSLQGYGGELDSKEVISVVDAVRFAKINDISIPIVTDGIEAADIIAINKIDLINDEDYKNLADTIYQIRSDAPLHPVSVQENINVENLLDKILNEKKEKEEKEYSTEEEEVPRPTVYAREFEYNLKSSYNIDSINETFGKVIENISSELEKSNCTLIGHIKMILKGGKGGYLMVNKTDFKSTIQFKGKLPANLENLSVAINCIVYGVHKDTVNKIVDNELNNLT